MYQTLALESPDLIRNAGVISDIAGAVSQIQNVVAQNTANLNCPQLSKYDYNGSQLNQYPGWTRLKPGGTY